MHTTTIELRLEILQLLLRWPRVPCSRDIARHPAHFLLTRTTGPVVRKSSYTIIQANFRVRNVNTWAQRRFPNQSLLTFWTNIKIFIIKITVNGVFVFLYWTPDVGTQYNIKIFEIKKGFFFFSFLHSPQPSGKKVISMAASRATI